jgi:hypothetical protein
MNGINTGDQAQWIYKVEVQQCGSPIAFYMVEAPDALSAINRVELLYGEPLTVEKTAIEDEEGDRHRITLAHHWHGYMFQARAVKLVMKTIINWRQEPSDLLYTTEV